jgi:hypothetical protein
MQKDGTGLPFDFSADSVRTVFMKFPRAKPSGAGFFMAREGGRDVARRHGKGLRGVFRREV